jgi:pyruvate,water dikinase
VGQEWVLGWQQAAAAGARVCGGKGWNLGRLQRYGFHVPAGGVLVAGAYTRFMAAGVLPSLEAAVADVPATAATDPAVEGRLAILSAAVACTELPADVQASVRCFLNEAGLAGVRLAVRSSATTEDGAAASFAGIHHSVLNVSGAEQVLQAIKACYASLWTPAALAYRRRQGLADQDVACAVVLCAMVGAGDGPPQAAGVAFSCDPRTGRRDLLTISAGPGLGADLAGGRSNAEEVVVLLARGRLRVVQRQGRERVLTDDEVLRLARQVCRVHWALGDGQDPQDVEWAYDGGRFWMLQARPVTGLPRVHFRGNPSLPVIWSNANLNEIVPGVPSPMGWSMLQMWLRDIYASVEGVGYPVPPGREVARRFSGRPYFDFAGLQWAFYDCFGLLPAELNRSLGGHQAEIPLPPGNPFRGRKGWGRLWTRLKLIGSFRPLTRQLTRDIADLHAAARQLKGLDLSRQAPHQLLGVWQELLNRWEFGPRYQSAMAGAKVWQTVLERLLDRLAPGRGPNLAAALMSGSGLVPSAEQGYRLLGLASTARRDPAAQAYLERAPLDPAGWRRLPEGSPFRAAMEQFLADFGHRGIYETDIANPRWNEDPTYLLEQVRLFLAEEGPQPAQEIGRAKSAAAEAEVARRTFWLRPVVRWLAARARQGAALREAGKAALLALFESVRSVALETGRRLATGGLLDNPADVFYLTLADWESYLRGEWDGRGARSLVADRKAQAAAWLAASPLDVILDARAPVGPPATGLGTSDEARPASGGRALRGLGVAAGHVSGPARIVRHPSEGHRLQPGDVLVAPTTDPAWAPLLLRACGLATEMGGYLSHGAIVAREFGIPAVVNIPDLLRAVEDGQPLHLDGDAGLVVLN